MKLTWKLPLFVLIFLGITGVPLADTENQRSLLVVTSIDSSLTSISPKEVRKLFLGVPVSIEGIRLQPLRNITDREIQEVFLQKVMFMSERNYERRLLSFVFRHGGERPETFPTLPELVHALRKSSDTISYMWSDELANYKDLKSVGVLWNGQIN